jgi:hypothetical protein
MDEQNGECFEAKNERNSVNLKLNKILSNQSEFKNE